MFLKPLKCPKCNREGRPGEEGLQILGDFFLTKSYTVSCECGHGFAPSSDRAQLVLSNNAFVRLLAASNQVETGLIEAEAGKVIEVSFKKPFEHLSKVFFTPMRPSDVLVKDLELRKDGMTVISASRSDKRSNIKKGAFTWLVFGLVDVNKLPTWNVKFYSAITQAENGLWQSSLFDYAVAFEIFIESMLHESLTTKYGKLLSQYLLSKTWQMERRVTELLEIAICCNLRKQKQIYKAWDKNVREPRNLIAHGKTIKITRESLEKAHQAVYHAILFINDARAANNGVSFGEL